MQKKLMLDILKDLKESADVEKYNGVYESLKKTGMNSLANDLKLWADTWLLPQLNQLEELIRK